MHSIKITLGALHNNANAGATLKTDGITKYHVEAEVNDYKIILTI